MHLSQAKQIYLSMGILSGFYIFDFFFTKAIIGNTSFEAEVNPIMHSLLAMTGTIYCILYVKLMMLVVFISTMLTAYKERPSLRTWLVVICWMLALFTVGVDLWSIYVLKMVSQS